MAGSVLELEPGALRELHWHPNADEWQYYLEGQAQMGVFLSGGEAVTEEFEAGDVGYAPMGAATTSSTPATTSAECCCRRT